MQTNCAQTGVESIKLQLAKTKTESHSFGECLECVPWQHWRHRQKKLLPSKEKCILCYAATLLWLARRGRSVAVDAMPLWMHGYAS